ncbi:hypothetical protein HDV63DRAFT_131650 [Trichoderma sp. SZMC 28014]
MRQHLDSTKFTDKQKTEEYINKVLEGLSIVPSLEKDKDMLIKLKHDCFNIPFALYQLTKLDYRVRVHIARCLQGRATGSCDQCAKLAAFELAFCYTLGFGVDSNKAEADKWLGQSGLSANELSARLDHLKDLTTADHETLLESGSQSIEHFFFSPEGRYGLEKLGSAEAYLAREIHDFERQLGDNHWQTFQLKADLIHLLSAQGKLSEAIKASEEFRLGTLERYGDSHILHIKAILLLADLHAEQHHWDEAETLLYDAKTLLFKEFGPGFLLSIQACGTLGRVYADRGKYEEAEAEFRRLMAVIPETLHADHYYVTQAAVRYSDLLDKREKYVEANELRNWHMQESTISKRFAALARESNRGREIRLQGNSTEAIEILTRVKQDAENLLSGQSGGANNDFWEAAMVTTRNLALAIRDQKRFQEAEVMQRDLKMKREENNGLLHKETLNITFDLARTLQMQERWTEAKELQLRVKHGRTENLGWAADETLYCSEHLINIYEAQGELTSAENEMQTIQNAYMERYGSKHEMTLNATQRLANMYLSHNKIELAQVNLETLVSLSQVVQGPYHEDTLGAQSNLALSYKAQGRLQDAEELLQKTLQDMQVHLGDGHQFISLARNHLTELRILLLYPTSGNFFEPTVLSEDEQIQMAIEASLRADQGMLEKDDENDEDGDEDEYEDEEETLCRAIAMSLEVKEEEPTTEMS